MAYLSLYRKYRSQRFDEVAGQGHVTQTLQNAIRSGRVAHAYLFCGPRGTGKTTSARLLAKALNCERGPLPEPCNECGACTQINEGRFMDMKEIDAASNRGIDEIRDLRDNVVYAPVEGRYKVYVIDEAHQITGDAFNAFLKTLEEPPPHVVFIMATTEAHKIPATIVSRCQKFEFRRASLEQLRERVAYVAEQEGATIEPAALDLIARDANGGWRDALSLLEQVLAFCDGTITAKEVYTVLGTVEADTLYALAEEIRETDGAEVFRLLDEQICEGKDPRQLLRDLTAHYRMLMLTGAGNTPAGDADASARIAEQAKRYGQGRLITSIEVLAQAEREARWSEQPRLLVEVAVARLMYPRESAAVPQQAAPAARPAATPAPSRPQASPAPRQAARSGPPPVEAPPPVSPSPEPQNDGKGTARPAFGKEELPPPPLTVGDARTGDSGDEDLLASFADLPPSRSESLPEPPPARAEARSAPRPEATPQRAAVEQTPAEPPPAPAASSPPATSGSGDIAGVRSKWKTVMEELVRLNKRTVQVSLVDTQPDRFEDDVLVVRFPTKTNAEMFTGRGKAFSEPLVQAVQRVTGIACRVRAEVQKGDAAAPGPPAKAPPSAPGGPSSGRAPSPASPPEPAPSAPAVPGGTGQQSLLPSADSAAPAPHAANGTAAPAPRPASEPAPAVRSDGTGSELIHNVLEVFEGKIVDDREPVEEQ
jgi:DNA polymerase-3 subunit gamma/tau